MLNGNMVAGTSKRGLLVRGGRDRQPDVLARPGAKPMEMGGRMMEGYVFVDPAPYDEEALQDWLGLAACFKPPKSKPRRSKIERRLEERS
jgi:hypothetical protein